MLDRMYFESLSDFAYLLNSEDGLGFACRNFMGPRSVRVSCSGLMD